MPYLHPSKRVVALMSLVLALAGCTPRPDRNGESATPTGSGAGEQAVEGAGEITREQAIEIARKHVTFEPRTVEAVAEEDEGRPVWRVTFRGRPPGPEHAMGELQEILVDRRTGEVVSLAMS